MRPENEPEERCEVAIAREYKKSETWPGIEVPKDKVTGQYLARLDVTWASEDDFHFAPKHRLGLPHPHLIFYFMVV